MLVLTTAMSVLAGAGPASASSQVFNFVTPSGGEQTFTVPAGVTSVHVTAVGAKGGASVDGSAVVQGSGGFGGIASADLAVTSGQVLYVEVGGTGGAGNSGSFAGAGGFNGGAVGGQADSSQGTGGGGGGASDIRNVSCASSCTGTQPPGSLNSRLVVAGGGGGVGGWYGGAGAGSTGGGGGGATGLAAGGSASCAGGGGLDSDGGSAGSPGGTKGALGAGGSAGSGGLGGGTGGGGGGGGYYGGGGGGAHNGSPACGGGGGSGHFGSGTSNGSFAFDTAGTASITITYVVPPTVSIGPPLDGATYTLNQVVDAAYTCTPASGATLSSCDGTVANGSPIDTTTLGSHTFTVTAHDNDSGTATSSVTYTVAAPTPTPTPIVTKPAITQARQSHRTWREGSGHKGRKRRPPTGTNFTFTLNIDAAVTFTFTRQVTGRKVNGRCVARTRKNRKQPSCTRSVAAGRLTMTGHAGANSRRFKGVLAAGQRLAPGHYTVVIHATAAGAAAVPVRLRFTIVAG